MKKTALLLTLLLSAETARASALTCETVPGLMATLLDSHVVHRSFSKELKERAAEAYLRRIDPSRTLLLQKEADALEAELRGVVGEIRGGNCSRLDQINDQLVRHYRRMEKQVRAMVGNPKFAIDENIELNLDPDKRGFPKTTKERDQLLRAYVHFQMATYLAADTKLPEAKKQLIHRYELMTKRAREEKTDDILATYLDAFASALDPHSSYLSADDLEDFRIALTLSLEGIGAELSSRDGYTTIERILPGGAADRHGKLQPKDKIIAVGQATGGMVNVIDMRLRDVVRMIRGKSGTEVRLAILRQGESTTERFTVSIVRDKIDLEEQAASLTFQTVERGKRKLKLAVLDLPSFYGDIDPRKRQADDDVRKLLAEARGERADGLVLDMAHNSGGILEQAVAIAGMFLRSGDIVAVKDSREDTDYLPDPDSGIPWAGPMVVLTSRLSASGAEIVAGALRDYRRAVIVGDSHTFGKGSVQTMMPLPPGFGALKTTVGLYYLPAGNSTQHDGVTADIVLPSLTDTNEIGESSQPFALPTQSIARFISGDAAMQRVPPITSGVIEALRKSSDARVAKNDELNKEAERLAEMEKNRGKVKLSEILKEQRDAEERAEARAEARRKGEKKASPQLREALEILADLVVQKPELVKR